MMKQPKKIKCKTCHSQNYDIVENGPHLEARCHVCGEYIRWISKKEANSSGKIVIPTSKITAKKLF